MKLWFLLLILLGLVSANEALTLMLPLICVVKLYESRKCNVPHEVIQTPKDSRTSSITSIVDVYVDELLENLKNFIRRSRFDPIELPNAERNLKPIGSITLSSGSLEGTSLIERNGRTTLKYNATSKVLLLNLPIKFKTLMVTYNYLTEVLGLSIDGKVEAEVNNLEMTINLSFDFNAYKASINMFQIRDSGLILVQFTGNKLVDWLTNSMTPVVALVIQPLVLCKIESIVEEYLKTKVDEVNELIRTTFNF